MTDTQDLSRHNGGDGVIRSAMGRPDPYMVERITENGFLSDSLVTITIDEEEGEIQEDPAIETTTESPSNAVCLENEGF